MTHTLSLFSLRRVFLIVTGLMIFMAVVVLIPNRAHLMSQVTAVRAGGTTGAATLVTSSKLPKRPGISLFRNAKLAKMVGTRELSPLEFNPATISFRTSDNGFSHFFSGPIDFFTFDPKVMPAEAEFAQSTCTIVGDNDFCGDQDFFFFAPTGQFTYQWSVTGDGTINGSAVNQMVHVMTNPTGTFVISLTLTSTVNGSQTTCNKTVEINATPPCSISGQGATCPNSTGLTYTAPAGADLSYQWSITGNGAIVGSATGQSVSVNATSAGSFTLNLTVTNTVNHCSSTCSKTVTVGTPACAVTGPDAACAGSASNTFSGPAGANLSYSWSISGNGTIVGANNQQTVNVTAGSAGSFTLTLVLTDTKTGCSSTCTRTVTVNALPTCSISGASSVCSTVLGHSYAGPAGANLSYNWSISGNGTIAGSTTGQSVTVNSGNPGSFTLTLTLTDTQTGCINTCATTVAVTDCDPKGPGTPYPATGEVSDQKAGSVLIYNLYTSSASAPNLQDTRVSITNVSQMKPVAVHMFFIDGASCSVADSFICLTANQTSTFLTSDLDPGTTGYIVAVAVDCNTGCPINFNCLIGDEYVKLATGHAANLGAEAISALTASPTVCDATTSITAINFDGVSYNRIPRVLALDNIGSRADGNDTLLVLNRIGGNLGIGTASLGAVFGIFFDDAETAVSFSFTGGCQFRSSISNNFPRITPRFEGFVPPGRTGWFKLWIDGDSNNKGILGASLNFNANAGSTAGAYTQGHNLHKLRMDTFNSYIIPVFPPPCCR